jgi:hypothetical protein
MLITKFIESKSELGIVEEEKDTPTETKEWFKSEKKNSIHCNVICNDTYIKCMWFNWYKRYK